MMLNINNETDRLEAVVLGEGNSMGETPSIEETYDAKSYESVMRHTYPKQSEVCRELSCFEKILNKYDIRVFKPKNIKNCNQVFARDVGFVIGDKIIVSNIIPNRDGEKEAYEDIYSKIPYNKIYNLPEKAHVEGGDVVLYNDIVFLGIYTKPDYPELKTARTNRYALDFLKDLCPEKNFIPIELAKDDKNPRKCSLHLDCTFMPVGKDKCILHKNGFSDPKYYEKIVEIFGKENVLDITDEEAYLMETNIFSLSPDIVVSERNFSRVNKILNEKWGIKTEEIPYYEISKMGGLLRCSTFPLIREPKIKEEQPA